MDINGNMNQFKKRGLMDKLKIEIEYVDINSIYNGKHKLGGINENKV